MITKHTPGPWEADDCTVESETAPICIVYESSDFPCSDDGEKLEAECRANCLLIAAAPDLLAACEKLLLGQSHYAEAYEMARQAVAKAV